MSILLRPGSVPLSVLETVYRTGASAHLDKSFDAAIEKGAARIAEISAGEVAVYGVNTGFGKLASLRIDVADVTTLQRNLILSHCCGVGAPLGGENLTVAGDCIKADVWGCFLRPSSTSASVAAVTRSARTATPKTGTKEPSA